VYFKGFLVAGAGVFKWPWAFWLIRAPASSDLACIEWQGRGFYVVLYVLDDRHVRFEGFSVSLDWQGRGF